MVRKTSWGVYGWVNPENPVKPIQKNPKKKGLDWVIG